MDNDDLNRLLAFLVALPKETEWLEFKANFHSEEEIGERLSALSNSAAYWINRLDIWCSALRMALMK